MSVYLGDVGTKIRLDCGEDISTATKCEIKFHSPAGLRGTWTASQETTSIIFYVTQAEDINEAGRWWFQAYVEMPSRKLYGKTAMLEVLSPL